MKYFNLNEFDCKCGCGRNNMQTSTLEKLDEARELAGVPFKINSGCRCSTHNVNSGSTSRNHLSGRAADINATDSFTRGVILRSLILVGFKRIGLHRSFIHADDMDILEATWFY